VYQSSTCSYPGLVASTPGLLGYWRLGESSGTTATDLTGAHDGTYEGGYTLGVAGALTGDTNTAAAFNGTTGYVELPALGSSSDWTIEGWTDLAGSATGNNALFAGFGGPRLLVTPDGYYADDYTNATAAGKMHGATASNIGTWAYWALVRNGSTLTVYRDGVELASSSLAGEGPTTLTGDIGAESNGAYHLAGAVDEVAVYDTALPAATLLEHYVVGAFTPAPYAATVRATSGLTDWWRLGDTSGSTAVDQVGAANGTYTGGYTLGVPSPIFNDPTTATGFDGTTGNVALPSLGASSTWTIEGWTKLSSSATGDNALYAATGGVRLLILPSGVYADDDAMGKISATTPTNLGTWVYWTLVRYGYDGSTLKLYRNGVQIATASLGSAGALPLNGDIGSQSGTTHFLNGDIADVAVYANTALNPSQIAQHWQSGVG
jgi:hypothetical protein